MTCQVDYAELRRQLEGWPKCRICNGPYIPSRSNEGGICGNTVLHFKIENEGKIQRVRRCLFCNSIIADTHKSGRKVRGDKLTCSDSCRVRLSQTRKESVSANGQELTLISQEGVRT